MLLFAGRLLPWKGAFLALKALELLPEWQLIIWDRPRRNPPSSFREVLGTPAQFREWVRRSELTRAMR